MAMNSTENVNIQSHKELYAKIEELFNCKINELKVEIQKISNTVSDIQEKYVTLEKRVVNLDRKLRKNNIVIFGLETTNQNDIVEFVIDKLNTLLETNFTETDVNDIYKFGQKQTVCVEFISYLSVKRIFKNVRKLKDTGVTIKRDLCVEDRETQKQLHQELLQVREKEPFAYIKGLKIYVNKKPYDEQLLREVKEPNPVQDNNLNSIDVNTDKISDRSSTIGNEDVPIANSAQENSFTSENRNTNRNNSRISTTADNGTETANSIINKKHPSETKNQVGVKTRPQRSKK